MFYGLTALIASFVGLLGLVLIVAVEWSHVRRWFRERHFDRLLEMALPAPAPERVEPVKTDGLIDPDPTDRIRMSEWLRSELAATKPAPAKAKESPRVEVPVLVLAGGASTTERAPEPRVRPSIREPRSQT